jgi:hypothetical protein
MEKMKIEYWMNVTLEPVPDDETPTTCHKIIKELWLERLRQVSKGLAQNIEILGDNFGYQIRYVFNSVRIWYVPTPSREEGITRPFAEESCARNKWYSTTNLMAFSFPPLPDDQVREEARIIFGPNHSLQERYDDPEVQGGKIALIAFKHLRVQKTPNCLDHMHSRYLKQVAYNDRVIEAEKEIASINADVPDFLSGMTLGPSEEVIICVNGSEEMKREEEAFVGQFWQQSDRQMTAYNTPYQGMANSRESAILTEVAEAVTWKHALEGDGPRHGKRVVIYPKELTQLDQVLSTGDPNIDSEDGHPIDYASILQAAQSYEEKPLFLREDHEQITSDPVKSMEVSKWMNTAAKVATGSRQRVLENGPDVMCSDDEDAIKEEHGDELTGVHAPGCVSLDQAKLTAEQAAAQRANSSESAACEPPRSQSPAYHSSDDDDLSRPEWIWSQTLGHARRNKAWVKKLAESALALPEPERKPTPVSSDTEDQEEMTEDQKRKAGLAK